MKEREREREREISYNYNYQTKRIHRKKKSNGVFIIYNVTCIRTYIRNREREREREEEIII
jgi:hypothetical protein